MNEPNKTTKDIPIGDKIATATGMVTAEQWCKNEAERINAKGGCRVVAVINQTTCYVQRVN